MNKILKYANDLHISGKFYRKVTIISLVGMIIAPLAMFLFFANSLKNMNSKIWAVDQAGNVLSASMVDKKTVRPLEAIAHARLFVSYMFEVDRYTYADKTLAAYKLGGSCIDALHAQMLKGNWDKDLDQYNASHSVIIDNVACESKESPYVVNILFRVINKSEISQPRTTVMQLSLAIYETNQPRTATNPNAELSIENIDIVSSYEEAIN